MTDPIDPTEPTARANPGEGSEQAAPEQSAAPPDSGVRPAQPGDAPQRLHPMSWLFELLAQLKSLAFPLLALLLVGRREEGPWWASEWSPLVGVAALVAAAVWRYLTYRYGIGEDALVVRSGRFERSLRVIPFARIHNVAIEQSLLHRLFGVASVRMESAGGKRPEAEMRVLRLEDALALEALVRHRGGSRGVEGAGARAEASAAPALLELPLGELLRLGLISNRGVIVVSAGAAALSQLQPNLLPRLVTRWGETLFGWATERQLGALGLALAALTLLAAAVVLMRVFSVALALLQDFGFVLSQHGRRLTVERGLVTRNRSSVSRRRIQAWTLREGLLHRLFQRRSLEIDTAGSGDPDKRRTLRDLAPIARPEVCDGLITHLLPKANWTGLTWSPIARRNWWRLMLPGLPWTLALLAVLGWRFGAWGLLVLLWWPWAAFKAWKDAGAAAWALGDALIAVREGWWARQWRFAEVDKLQALQLTHSPLDRRCGTATLWLDTAGAGQLHPLRIRFLPEADARALQDRLARTLARRPLRW